MSATEPYLQRRLPCGCIVTADVDPEADSRPELWTVADVSPRCHVHIRGEWISATREWKQ